MLQWGSKHNTQNKDEVMDKQVEAVNETLVGIQTFVERYPFPLDPFQLEAIAQLAQGQSVMVAAPTGTGKTIVAEYAIWLAQQRNQRVIYTTPLKALSNQKYRDLRNMYGFDNVGLVTGDIVEHSRASVVIMTTEVYRNMLLEEGGDSFAGNAPPVPSSLADVSFVIFDELHYLSDIERGPVWEEAIICSPPMCNWLAFQPQSAMPKSWRAGSVVCIAPLRWSCMSSEPCHWSIIIFSITNCILRRMPMGCVLIVFPAWVARQS